jgi:hypothetical protein
MNITNETNGPTAPTIAFSRGREIAQPEEFSNDYDIRVKGFTQERDREDYFADLEQRKARSVAFEAKRQQVKQTRQKLEPEHINEVLDSLHDADLDFTNSYGKPNTELLAQRELVAELTARLAEEQSKLDVIEARGSSVDRLNAAVQRAESQFQAMLSRAESAEIQRLATNLYGWSVPFDQLSSERKREFRLHSSIIELKKLQLPTHPHKTEDVGALQARLQSVGKRLVQLRDMITDGLTAQ